MKHLSFILVLFIAGQTGHAQTIEKKNSSVYINYPDYSVKAVVLNDGKKIAPSDELTYYWYAQNMIKETKGGYDGRLLDGEYTALYLSNNLKEKGFFKKGLKDGKWTAWYENGAISEITTWSNGRKKGEHKTFDLNGNKVLETNYNNDLLDGEQINYADGAISKKQYKAGVEVVPVEKPQEQAVIDSETKEKKKGFFKRIKLFRKKDKAAS